MVNRLPCRPLLASTFGSANVIIGLIPVKDLTAVDDNVDVSYIAALDRGGLKYPTYVAVTFAYRVLYSSSIN